MAATRFTCIAALLALMGCGIPPVDPTFISSTPADRQSFAVAEQATRACRDVADKDKLLRNLQRAGFDVRVQPLALRNGNMASRTLISPPDDAVSVLILGNSCYVGLEGMTPQQSFQLAQIWVRAFDAKPNSAFGDGLSDHVSGAWRHFFTEPFQIPDKAAYRHRVYIAAYKTWPHGVYDPQREVGYDIESFPEAPGAAIRLNHVVECEPQQAIGPRMGVFLPCSGSEFTPNE